MTDETKSMLAVILSMRRAQTPRRHLKRALRDNGFAATADALDDLLDQLDGLSHAERAEIELRADRLDVRDADAPVESLDHDDFLIAENVAGDRTYLVYRGVDGSFVGEIFDRGTAPVGYESAPLADGQVLSNVIWDGDPPPAKERHRLYTLARQALRAYDARLGVYEGD